MSAFVVLDLVFSIVSQPGTQNRFLNIVSLTYCIICVLYESLFVNNESRNIGLKLMRLSFYFLIHSFLPIVQTTIGRYQRNKRPIPGYRQNGR